LLFCSKCKSDRCTARTYLVRSIVECDNAIRLLSTASSVWSSPPPFPSGAIRDALGLVRLLWLAERDGLDSEAILRSVELTEIGEALRQSLKGAAAPPDSREYAVALARSSAAVRRLLALGWSPHVAELVKRAADRVQRGSPRIPDDRELRRQDRARR
jgi:hypothetical protein